MGKKIESWEKAGKNKQLWMLIKREEVNKEKRGEDIQTGGEGRGVALVIGQRKKSKINKGEV